MSDIPEQCDNGETACSPFPARVCPIGASMLDLPTSDALRKRIDDGYSMIANAGGEGRNPAAERTA